MSIGQRIYFRDFERNYVLSLLPENSPAKWSQPFSGRLSVFGLAAKLWHFIITNCWNPNHTFPMVLIKYYLGITWARLGHHERTLGSAARRRRFNFFYYKRCPPDAQPSELDEAQKERRVVTRQMQKLFPMGLANKQQYRVRWSWSRLLRPRSVDSQQSYAPMHVSLRWLRWLLLHTSILQLGPDIKPSWMSMINKELTTLLSSTLNADDQQAPVWAEASV